MKQYILVLLFFIVVSLSGQGEESFLTPWPADVPLPNPEEVDFPTGAVHTIVQDCDKDPDYGFLHETAVSVWQNEVIVAWYNNIKQELQGKTLQRARRSRDGGKTWSEPEIIMDRDNAKGLMYVGIQFLVQDGNLYAFSNQEHGTERPVDCLLLSWNEKGKVWKELGPVAPRFLSMQQPIAMDNGNYIISGSYNPTPGAINGIIPTVYISQGKNLSKPWHRYLMDTEYVNVFAETAVIVDGPNILGVTRREDSPWPNFYESVDYGKTWRKIENKTFMASCSKFSAGTLSNGVKYILYNLPDFQKDSKGQVIPTSIKINRRTLVMATAQPGEKAFSKIWKISDNTTVNKNHESHYPCAVEYEGKLYITYTGRHTLRNCSLTVIPVDSFKQ